MSSQLDKPSQLSALNDACRKGVPHQNCFITSNALQLSRGIQYLFILGCVNSV